jgi:hypothetical protein
MRMYAIDCIAIHSVDDNEYDDDDVDEPKVGDAIPNSVRRT